jgi:dephospho-CoA kinase
MSAVRIPVIGIIGGIGSGKTAIANAVSEFVSVCRLDGDVIGHEVLRQVSVREALRSHFDNSIFDNSGEVVRSEVAALVFGTEPEKQAARRQLELIVHPEIRKFIEIQLKEIQYQQICDVIIIDAALLLEAGWSSVCDAIVYLDVPEQLRLQRVKQRGWTEAQFREREASQLPLHEKEQHADITIDNGGDLQTATKKLADWFHSRFPNQQAEVKT